MIFWNWKIHMVQRAKIPKFAWLIENIQNNLDKWDRSPKVVNDPQTVKTLTHSILFLMTPFGCPWNHIQPLGIMDKGQGIKDKGCRMVEKEKGKRDKGKGIRDMGWGLRDEW